MQVGDMVFVSVNGARTVRAIAEIKVTQHGLLIRVEGETAWRHAYDAEKVSAFHRRIATVNHDN